jgi:hypothetical protein
VPRCKYGDIQGLTTYSELETIVWRSKKACIYVDPGMVPKGAETLVCSDPLCTM